MFYFTKNVRDNTIINEFRELIKVYGCNFCERMVHLFKRVIKGEEDLFCNDDDDVSVQDLK